MWFDWFDAGPIARKFGPYNFAVKVAARRSVHNTTLPTNVCGRGLCSLSVHQGGFVRSQEMPHPRRATGEVNVPRFSELVGNTSPYLPEPAANTTLPAPPAKRLPFSPRVAAYTLAFVATIVGGIYLGATSRDMMEQWEVRILFFL